MLAQIDTVYEYWNSKSRWEHDQLIQNYYNYWHLDQHISISLGIPTSDGVEIPGYQVEYFYVIDTAEINRVDNLVYRVVLRTDTTMTPPDWDLLGYHPILDDGYASFWKRDPTGNIILVRKYVKQTDWSK
jgi:hypothetical protein